MTVEVGILNKQGIALAADSAVTIGNGDKFYNTANKLFALSKFHPVGIMIYSNAELMQYPVEIVVKEYRKRLEDNSFSELKGYWNDFLQYLLSVFGEDDNTEYFINHVVNSFLNFLDGEIREEADKLLNTMQNKSKEEIQFKLVQLINDTINDLYEYYMNMEDDEEFKDLEDVIINRTRDQIKDIAEQKIGILGEEETEKLVRICIMILTKKHPNGNKTGIVVAGYGDNELYPSLIYGEFLGIFFGKIKYNIKKEVKITNDIDSSIIPFAQVDVINTFMNGIDTDMYREILDTIDECKESLSEEKSCECNVNDCLEKLKENIKEKVDTISWNDHWGPIVQTVSVAPKEELAQMAETLVNLTSFRRKLMMDSYSQSVGGPIDVALITKGDGFIWIKRKHYFNKDLNHNFFQNYFK